MGNNSSSQNELNLDTRVLSNFIIEFNISLRLVTSYPKNHPIITGSIEKVLRLLEDLLEYREEIAVGVARDTLMVEYALLDPKNPVYRNLAKILFSHDIASICFNRKVSTEELIRFNEIIACKPENIRNISGIEQAVIESEICNIVVKCINYRQFRTTEEDSIAPSERKSKKGEVSTLWENFAHGVLEGSLDPNGAHATFANTPDPGVLADMMNESDNRLDFKEESYAKVIASFMGDVDNGEYDAVCQKESIDKLNKFIRRLSPAIRKQFLNGVFTCPDMNQSITNEMLAKFPDDIILEALEDINSTATYTPPVTISLLQRLAKTAPTESWQKTVSTSFNSEDYDHLGEKLRIIFREDKSDEFIPTAYQKALRAITSMDRITMPELEEIEELRQTLLSHSVQTQVCRVILEAMRSPSDKCKPESLEQNFLELVNYFLETGDFLFLASIYGQLNMAGQLHFPDILDFFTKQNFLDQILDCLDSWEKAKHSEIRSLICQIGSPFVEPLLERLAEEQTMSLRRSYLFCLLGLGEKVRDAAIARLTDSRWYFVRNLIIILRELNDFSILGYIRRLRNNSHPRVRQEIIKTFQHFNHSEADQLLLQDMNSSRRELQLNAIQLAEKSRSPEVFKKLLSILDRGGVTNFDFEIKRASIRTLAQIKNDKALPSLMQYVRSKHLLRQQTHNRLKADIISSLCNYRPECVAPLLEEISKSDLNELAILAKETLNDMQGEK